MFSHHTAENKLFSHSFRGLKQEDIFLFLSFGFEVALFSSSLCLFNGNVVGITAEVLDYDVEAGGAASGGDKHFEEVLFPSSSRPIFIIVVWNKVTFSVQKNSSKMVYIPSILFTRCI